MRVVVFVLLKWNLCCHVVLLCSIDSFSSSSFLYKKNSISSFKKSNFFLPLFIINWIHLQSLMSFSRYFALSHWLSSLTRIYVHEEERKKKISSFNSWERTSNRHFVAVYDVRMSICVLCLCLYFSSAMSFVISFSILYYFYSYSLVCLFTNNNETHCVCRKKCCLISVCI